MGERINWLRREPSMPKHLEMRFRQDEKRGRLDWSYSYRTDSTSMNLCPVWEEVLHLPMRLTSVPIWVVWSDRRSIRSMSRNSSLRRDNRGTIDLCQESFRRTSVVTSVCRSLRRDCRAANIHSFLVLPLPLRQTFRSRVHEEDFYLVRLTIKGDEGNEMSSIAGRRFFPRFQSIKLFVAFLRLFIFQRSFPFFYLQFQSNVSLRLLIENTLELKRRGEKEHRCVRRRTIVFEWSREMMPNRAKNDEPHVFRFSFSFRSWPILFDSIRCFERGNFWRVDRKNKAHTIDSHLFLSGFHFIQYKNVTKPLERVHRRDLDVLNRCKDRPLFFRVFVRRSGGSSAGVKMIVSSKERIPHSHHAPAPDPHFPDERKRVE